MAKYRNHDRRKVLLSKQYGEHVYAMTSEKLHNKGEIAEELAARDITISLLIEALDDLLETCELNGMHDDKTYQRNKEICARFLATKAAGAWR